MAHGVTRRIQYFQLDSFPYLDYVTCCQTLIHVWYRSPRIGMGDDSGASCGNHWCVAPDMITMFMSIENLCDFPAHRLSFGQTLLMIKWIHCKSFT